MPTDQVIPFPLADTAAENLQYFSPARCDRRSTSVHMVQVRDDRGRLGPTNDGEVEVKHEQSPDFCRFALSEASFSILTLVKAALFTAIVTSFTLDAMSDLEEDTSTKLLRILVEQSTTGQDVDIPQPNPPSSIVMVNGLWFLSIMSSLAATTWAMLSLEWFAFLTEGVRAEDYEEMAEKRQRKFEAVRRWKMHIVVASIPFFLHISFFLFLAGLWLRLRDVNKHLELVVGIPSLVIVSSYVIVSMLPLFTEAPFFTSVSEMFSPLVNEIKYFVGLRHFVHAPLIFSWISTSFTRMSSKSLPHLNNIHQNHLYPPLRTVATLLIYSLKYIYKLVGPPAHGARTIITKTLLPIFPTFRPGGDTFKELNRLQIGRSGRDKGVHQRALCWLMNTPLTCSEVKEVLKEFSNLGGVEEPLDRSIVKLLVLSLSSVLENGRITEDEQPIFDHCTRILTEEMSRAFRDANYNPRILVRNAAISDGLKEYLDFDAFSPPPEPGSVASDDYWNRVVRLLWLSPSKEKIQVVIEKLELIVRSMNPSLLQRVVRGLHAATLASLHANQPTFDPPLPDFNHWGLLDDGSTGERLDPGGDLSAFLQSLLTKFHKAAQPPDQKYKIPTSIHSLIADCLELLDGPPRPDITIPLEFHNTLCFFITMLWRSEPGMFDTDPSVAQTLVTSVTNFIANPPQETSNHSEKLTIRLLAITNGPKHLVSGHNTPLETIANLYTGIMRDYPECLPEFIHMAAAALEAVFVKENYPGVPPDLRLFMSRRIVRNIVPTGFFTDGHAFNLSRDNPVHRLPYLYSLAIALSREVGGDELNPLEVTHLFRTLGEQRENTAVERILDTNVLVVAVLKLALSHRPEPVFTEVELRGYLDPITQALQPLQNIIERRGDYPWRTRWKSIYLLADIRRVLHPTPIPTELQTIINNASGVVRTYLTELRETQAERTPRDWKMKREELALCRLEGEVRDLATLGEANEGVYEWRDSRYIPYLSLYPQRTRYDPTSGASYRFLEKLQR